MNSNILYNAKIKVFGEYIEDFKKKQKILKKSYKCSNTKYLYDINVIEKNLLLRLILYIIGFYFIEKCYKNKGLIGIYGKLINI